MNCNGITNRDYRIIGAINYPNIHCGACPVCKTMLVQNTYGDNTIYLRPYTDMPVCHLNQQKRRYYIDSGYKINY